MRVHVRAAMLCALMLPTAAPAFAQSPSAAASASASAIKRTEIYKGPVAAADHEAVLMKVELAPGGHAPRHTHPGDEVSYVTDGDIEITLEGQAPVRLKAGQGFSVPAGKIHEARNVGKAPVHLIGVYIVEKGKPLATPVK
jgi:quercetin dioxygenase-like cupin family protein